MAVNVVGNYVVDSLVAETENRAAAGNAWDILAELLRSSFRWLVVGRCPLPRRSVAGRAWAPRSRRSPRPRAGAPRARLGVRGARRLFALLLLFTGPAGDFARYLAVLTLVALGAAWIELMRTQTLREFPDASALRALRGRPVPRSPAGGRRGGLPRREPAQPAPRLPGTSTARLASLADLHARGVLTDEEFASAKARMLAGD